jgi:hypothetical protein
LYTNFKFQQIQVRFERPDAKWAHAGAHVSRGAEAPGKLIAALARI